LKTIGIAIKWFIPALAAGDMAVIFGYLRLSSAIFGYLRLEFPS
jgi:hypothetical protein